MLNKVNPKQADLMAEEARQEKLKQKKEEHDESIKFITSLLKKMEEAK